MDIIYLANSENTYYINLFNLTIALVYLIEKSPPIREIKALSNDRGTRGQVAFPFGASTSFNSSRAEGKSGYPGGGSRHNLLPPPFPLFRICFNDLMKSWRPQPPSPPAPTALSSQTYVDILSSKYLQGRPRAREQARPG